MKTRMLLPALLVAGLGLSSTAYAATTITFDEYASNNNNTPITSLYASLGVTFGNDNSGTWGGLGSGDPGSWSLLGTNGSAFLGNNGLRNGSTYTTTVNFASLINSVSFDVSRSNGSSDGQTLTAEVYRTGALVGTQSITLGAINQWSTISFSNGSYDTLVLKGSANGFSPYGIDNLQIAAVPEPETYALFMAGLGLMGTVARRRKAARG